MPPTALRLGAYLIYEKIMSKRRHKKRHIRKRTKITILVAVAILILLSVGIMLDAGFFQTFEEQQPDANPYIELYSLEGEQYLVGDAIVEWIDGVSSGEDIYKKYSSSGRVYSAQPVTVRYTINDIPLNVQVDSQQVELSESSSFENSKKFDLPGNKRSIAFEYLYTNTTYFYRVTAFLSDGNELTAEGRFDTADSPRVISAEGVWNMRDIGGVKTVDGKTLKQGLVYRGVELDGAIYNKYHITGAGINVLTEELGIKSEMDLREYNDKIRDMLGDGVNHTVYGVYAYVDSLEPYYSESYRRLFSDLAQEGNYPVYIHCTYGKDRTGTVCFLLQLLAGVSLEDAYKEWELSVLLDGKIDYNLMEDYIEALEKIEGDTMQEKVENHLLSFGVTKSEIESIREILVEDYVSDYDESKDELNILKGKKIVYDGDSIALGLYADGGYPKMIAERTYGKMENFAVGGGRLVSSAQGEEWHSVVDNLKNLPLDGDLYCFQAGINDYWTYVELGSYDLNDFNGALDTTTVCGALETIFRYMKEIDKPAVFVISHKIQHTAEIQNDSGDTFADYHDAMVAICEKYNVPYYDAFLDSGLDGSNTKINTLYLTGNSEGKSDGTHPNAKAYGYYYVPQLIKIFAKAFD